jgi:hypothetical protein
MISFNEYLEDILNLHAGLMTEEELASARKGYDAMCAPKKVAPAHPDSKMTVAELRARCERLVNGQSGAIARCENKPEFAASCVSARAAVAEGRRILAAKRATKAEYIAHAEQNAAASREMNAAKK